MTTYTVTTSNWNDPAFWSSINQTTAGHTLDVSGLPSDYSVDVDEDTGAIQIAHFGSFFTIAGANCNGAFGAPNATLGGATVITYFSAVAGTGGNDTLASGSGADTNFGNDGNDSVVSGQGDDLVDGGGTYVQPTFENDNWAFRDEDGYYLEVIKGAPNQTVVYGGEGLSDAITDFNTANTGTMILTPGGEVAVELLRPGDAVVTRDNGLQRLVWCASRRLGEAELARYPHRRPIAVAPEPVGATSRLLVSPQYGMVIKRAGRGETLVRVRLCALQGAARKPARPLGVVGHCPAL